MCYPGPDPGPVMPEVPVNSRELDRVSMGITALQIQIPRKNMVRIAWSWLVQTGVAMSSNILIPSANSEGESPSQVPGQTCGPCELVELATSREMDVCLSSLWLTLQCIIFPRQMATRGVWIPEF